MTTRQGLADSYLASGQAKEAVSVYKRVVADRERALGPDHLDTNRARYSLGAAYQRTGKTVAAERVYEQARVGFERLLGPRHPDALRSRAELARACTASWDGTATPARCCATRSTGWSASCPPTTR